MNLDQVLEQSLISYEFLYYLILKVQNIHEIPRKLRDIYKTAYEIKQRRVVEMSLDRGAFIDQSQSLNLFLRDPTPSKISTLHFDAWEGGGKTSLYYLRLPPKATPQKVTSISHSTLTEAALSVSEEQPNKRVRLGETDESTLVHTCMKRSKVMCGTR